MSSNSLDPKELGQLAHFILSSSENDSESESDDDFKSRVNCDSDIERRQTRSPSSASKNPKKSPKKSDPKPKKSGSKRSLESILQRVSDLKKERDEEESAEKPPKKSRKSASPKSSKTLEKFFAAEMEMDKKNGSRKPSREIKSEPKNPESPKSPKSEPSRKGRKSNRPRKIEIVSPEDTWEHSENTVVDQNSTGGKDYLIAEGKID